MEEPLPQEPGILRIKPEQSLQRLDRFLAGNLEELSRSRVQELIRQGNILVNGRRVAPKYAVRSGDEIAISIPEVAVNELKPEPMELAVLFEDDWMLCIDKPAGLCVHPGSGHQSATLVHGLLHHYAGRLSRLDSDRPGIVHRLDKDTSGCMVVAKTDWAHDRLAEAFASRRLCKQYICVVSGRVNKSSGRIEDFLGRNPGNRQKIAVLDSLRGKRAITGWQVLEHGDGHSVMLCRIHTGRTHQIRVHMAYELGHPIVGDPIYGKATLRRSDANRLMLHAWRLGLTHPKTGQALEFEAPLPNELAAFRRAQ